MTNDRKPPLKRDVKIDVIYFLAVIFAVVFIRDLGVSQSHMKTIPYSEFRSRLDKGEFKDLQVARNRIIGTYTTAGEVGTAQHFWSGLFAHPRYVSATVRDVLEYQAECVFERGATQRFITTREERSTGIRSEHSRFYG